MLANVQAFFLEQNSALVPALFLLPPTHIVYLTDGDRKYTLIFFTPSNGGWKNQVTLSSQGLKVLIILWFHLLFFDLRFLIPPKKTHSLGEPLDMDLPQGTHLFICPSV